MDIHRVDKKATAYRRHMGLWNLGNMDTEEVDAILGAGQTQQRHLPAGWNRTLT